MTNGKRRRLSIILLALCLLLIAAIGAQMWHSLRQDRAIDYGANVYTADPPAVCPGDKISYPVHIDINTTPSVSRITEGWCRGDGICPRTQQAEPYSINFIIPYSVSATASRTIPADLPPGLWELRHCNETRASGVIDVTCYQVEVEVLACP